jgi:hypothetical protein
MPTSAVLRRPGLPNGKKEPEVVFAERVSHVVKAELVRTVAQVGRQAEPETRPRVRGLTGHITSSQGSVRPRRRFPCLRKRSLKQRSNRLTPPLLMMNLSTRSLLLSIRTTTMVFKAQAWIDDGREMMRSLQTSTVERAQGKEVQTAMPSKATTMEGVAMHTNLVQSQDHRLLRCSCCPKRCNANTMIHKATEDVFSYARRTRPGISKTFKHEELLVVPATGLQVVDQNKGLACPPLMRAPKDWEVAVIPKTLPSLKGDQERSRGSNSPPKNSKSVVCRWPDVHLHH